LEPDAGRVSQGIRVCAEESRLIDRRAGVAAKTGW
jgi:hypothetical protein